MWPRLCKTRHWNSHLAVTLQRGTCVCRPLWRLGTCFLKVLKLNWGASIPVISSQPRGSKSSNFAIFFVFLTLKTCSKIRFIKHGDCNLTTGFSGPKSSRDFWQTAPWPEFLEAWWRCDCYHVVWCLIIYMKKFLHSYWLRAVQKEVTNQAFWLVNDQRNSQMANQIFCFQIKRTPWMAQFMAQFSLIAWYECVSSANNMHEKITQFWLAEKEVQNV